MILVLIAVYLLIGAALALTLRRKLIAQAREAVALVSPPPHSPGRVRTAEVLAFLVTFTLWPLCIRIRRKERNGA